MFRPFRVGDWGSTGVRGFKTGVQELECINHPRLACMRASKRAAVFPPGTPARKYAASAVRTSALGRDPASAPWVALSRAHIMALMSSCGAEGGDGGAGAGGGGWAGAAGAAASHHHPPAPLFFACLQLHLRQVDVFMHLQGRMVRRERGRVGALVEARQPHARLGPHPHVLHPPPPPPPPVP